MTDEFLEGAREMAGGAFIFYLQTRQEEAVRAHDRRNATLLGRLLVGELEGLKQGADGRTLEMIEGEIGFVEALIGAEYEDAGSGYVLTDAILDGLDAGYSEDQDDLWAQYVELRIAEAREEGDMANAVFLTGKYHDEIRGMLSQDPEGAALLAGFDASWREAASEFEKGTGGPAGDYAGMAAYFASREG